jgi:hypothetical protein
MTPDSDVRNAVASTDALGVRCLADLPKYRSLEGRRRFLLQYWYALATVPFFLSIVIGVGVFPRLVPDTAFWGEVALALVFGALGWSFVVILYFLFVFVRWFLVRCPKCGWRFGIGDQCDSCGLPRTDGTSTDR